MFCNKNLKKLLNHPNPCSWQKLSLFLKLFFAFPIVTFYIYFFIFILLFTFIVFFQKKNPTPAS